MYDDDASDSRSADGRFGFGDGGTGGDDDAGGAANCLWHDGHRAAPAGIRGKSGNCAPQCGHVTVCMCDSSPATANVPDQPGGPTSNQPAEADAASVASVGSPPSCIPSQELFIARYTDDMLRELQVASRPLMDFLMKHHNPHVKAIVDSHRVEVVEGPISHDVPVCVFSPRKKEKEDERK